MTNAINTVEQHSRENVETVVVEFADRPTTIAATSTSGDGSQRGALAGIRQISPSTSKGVWRGNAEHTHEAT